MNNDKLFSTANNTKLSASKTFHATLKQALFKPVNKKRKDDILSYLLIHLDIHKKISCKIYIRPGYQVIFIQHCGLLRKHLLTIGFRCLKDLITSLFIEAN